MFLLANSIKKAIFINIKSLLSLVATLLMIVSGLTAQELSVEGSISNDNLHSYVAQVGLSYQGPLSTRLDYKSGMNFTSFQMNVGDKFSDELILVTSGWSSADRFVKRPVSSSAQYMSVILGVRLWIN